MIVDFHTHVFPDKIASPAIASLESRAHIKAAIAGTGHALYESMIGAVDVSIVLPVVTNPEKTMHLVDFAEQMNVRYASSAHSAAESGDNVLSCASSRPRIISFAGIHPDTADCSAVLAEIARRGFKGIKIHPDYQNTFIDDIRYERIIARASELGLITVVHAGIDIGLPEPVHCPPARARKMIDDVHPQNVVLAHLGGWKQWDDVERLLVNQNVYFDTAFTHGYISNGQFARIIKNHGAEKILFATDSPWSGQKESIADIRALCLTDKEKNLVLGENACTLLALQ